MGRESYSARRIVEYSFRIRIADLAGARVFDQSCTATSSGKIVQTSGCHSKEIASYSFTVSVAGAAGGSIAFIHDYNGRRYTGQHIIERQPVNLGGFRYFFRCAHCGRRVKALYFGGNAWACRTCCRLVYMNCRESRSVWRKQHAAEITRKKAASLRASNHPRLANRLDFKAEILEWQFEEEWESAFFHRFGHLV